MILFAKGQRYFSETEPDLGLGIVFEIENKNVKIFYPHANIFRTYNAKTSPLKRYRLKPGDQLKFKEQSYIVEKVDEQDGLIYYLLDNDLQVCESELDSLIELAGAKDKLFSGLIDDQRIYKFRYDSMIKIHHLEKFKYRGLMSARIGLIDHQLSILKTIKDFDKRKFILSDEVGLGKTIEAITFLSHLLQRELINSVLILTPQSLQYQWFIELFKKFQIVFKTIGLEDDVELNQAQDNENFLISSKEILMNASLDKDFIINKKWDMIIIDEAHQYDFTDNLLFSVKNIIDHAKYAILLSATPEALGENNFIKLQETLNFEFAHAQSFKNQEEFNYKSLFFKNKRIKLEGSYNLFPAKKLIEIPIHKKISNDLQALKEKSYAIRTHLTSQEKTLLITHSRDQAIKIRSIIEEDTNIKIAMFHSKMSLMERDRQVAYFQEPEGANLLICTEVGSEGRNFEIAKNLILMDIPHTPTHLTQRIGRLDRIGQKNDIQIIVPYIKDSFEENLMILYKGLEIFTQFPNGIDIYYEKNKTDINEAIKNNDKEKIKYFSLDYDKYKNDLLKIESPFSDQFSFNLTSAKIIKKELSEINTKNPLKEFIEEACHLFHIEIEDLNEEVFCLRSTAHMTLPLLNYLTEDGRSFTQNREMALIREDIELISWEHPIIKDLLDIFLSSDIGNCNIAKCEVFKGIELIFNQNVTNINSLDVKIYLPTTPLRVLLDFQGLDQTKKFPKKLIDNKSIDTEAHEREFILENLPKDKISDIINTAKKIARDKAELYLKKAIEEAITDKKELIDQYRAHAADSKKISSLELEKDEIIKQLKNYKLELSALRLLI